VFFVAGDEVGDGDGDVPDAGTALGLGLGDTLFEVTIALGDGDADAAAVCELDPQALSASATTTAAPPAAPSARAHPVWKREGCFRACFTYLIPSASAARTSDGNSVADPHQRRHIMRHRQR